MNVDSLKLALRVIATQLFPGMSARAPMFSLTRVPLIDKIRELEKSAEEQGVRVQRLGSDPGVAGAGAPLRRGRRSRAPGGGGRVKRTRRLQPEAQRAEPDDGNSSDSENGEAARNHGQESSNEDSDSDEALDPDDDIACATCGKLDSTDENPIVICDLEHCNRGLHLRCMTPPLAQVPETKWFCPSCVPRTRGGRRSAAKEKLNL